MISNIKYKDDIRYIRENSEILGVLNIEKGAFYKFTDKEHTQNVLFGNLFSISQEIYKLLPYITEYISNDKYPTINEMCNDTELVGYKVKYNVTEKSFFYPNTNKPIIRLYDYNFSNELYFNLSSLQPIIYNNGQLYTPIN